MLEKRTMWLVESDLTISQVIAICDDKEKTTVCYTYNNENSGEDWFRPRNYEKTFNTEQEAIEYKHTRAKEIRKMAEECQKMVNELEDLMGCDLGDGKDLERKDYLGGLANAINNNDGYWHDMYYREKTRSSLLATAVRSRHLNMSAETIDINEVIRVKWISDDIAELVMRDGHTVRTHGDTEYGIVEDLFGSNRSKMTFKK